MADAPTSAQVRAYNVGFGDCLLLTFRYRSGNDRTVLIDFGSTKGAEHGAPKSMEDVAEQIAIDCGGSLDVLVVSHRHADHLSGFAGRSGAKIADLHPKLIVQPWTEEPDLATTADEPRAVVGAGGPVVGMAGFVAELDLMHDVADIARRHADSAIEALVDGSESGHGRRTVLEQLSFLGETNVKNRPAVEALQAMDGDHVYVKFGDDLPIADLLPGVKVDVLGPPTVAQAPNIRSYAKHDENYWEKARLAMATLSATVPEGQPDLVATPLFPGSPTITVESGPQEGRWLVPQLDRLHAQQLLSLVLDLDGVMNNTSLILTFQVGDAVLLFPGDAQLENWSYALRDAPNAGDIAARLADTRLYKVGHHGSLNATPKKLLWETFARRGREGTPGRLISVMSTSPGKHGHVKDSTEVPRRTLMAKLRTMSDLVDTQTCKDAPTGQTSEFWRDTESIVF